MKIRLRTLGRRGSYKARKSLRISPRADWWAAKSRPRNFRPDFSPPNRPFRARRRFSRGEPLQISTFDILSCNIPSVLHVERFSTKMSSCVFSTLIRGSFFPVRIGGEESVRPRMLAETRLPSSSPRHVVQGRRRGRPFPAHLKAIRSLRARFPSSREGPMTTHGCPDRRTAKAGPPSPHPFFPVPDGFSPPSRGRRLGSCSRAGVVVSLGIWSESHPKLARMFPETRSCPDRHPGRASLQS